MAGQVARARAAGQVRGPSTLPRGNRPHRRVVLRGGAVGPGGGAALGRRRGEARQGIHRRLRG